MMHEERMHDESHFVTLTYDGHHLPEHGSLVPADLKAFVKALRKDYYPNRISFFGCGEYGEDNYRPHYHLITFGSRLLEDGRCAELWKKGLVDVGSVTMASASYVAGYVQKKVLRKENPEHLLRVDDETGEIVDVEPEFARMSLRPAIGRRWIEENWRDVYPRDYVVIEGREWKPPRYYDKWMDANQPEVMENVRDRRFEEMVELDAYELNAKRVRLETRTALYGRRNSV